MCGRRARLFSNQSDGPMIADDRDGVFETAIKMITAPVWVPIYFAGVGIKKLGQALQRRKPEQVQQVEALQPWMPSREFERAVYAALILAGEPINNRRLAELMDALQVKPQGGSRSSRASSAKPARVARF